MYEWIFLSLRIWWKRFEADTLHKLTGRKYYVIKVYGQLITTDRIGIKRLKQKKILLKSFDYAQLSEMAVYETPNPGSKTKNIKPCPS
jgi:hypothetical protein